MSIKYHCDLCGAERSQELLKRFYTVEGIVVITEVFHTCPSCRSIIKSAVDAAIERCKPIRHKPIAKKGAGK